MEPKKAKKRAIQLMKEFELWPRWSFGFDQAKQRIGYCIYGKMQIQLSKPLITRNSRAEVEDTIRHEIAHALAWENEGARGHGEVWKKWAAACGATPERCAHGLNGVAHKYYHYCVRCGQSWPRHRRSHRLYNCGRCGTGTFGLDRVIVNNIPAKKMHQIRAGEIDWQQTEQATITIEAMKGHDEFSRSNPIYQEYIGYYK